MKTCHPANVYIDGAKPGTASFVNLTGSRDAANITLDFGDTLSIANGAIFNIYGNLANAGQVDLTGGVAALRVANSTVPLTLDPSDTADGFFSRGISAEVD